MLGDIHPDRPDKMIVVDHADNVRAALDLGVHAFITAAMGQGHLAYAAIDLLQR